ncbi:hypothetical protein ABMA27_000707 [Loxostege sticticalis]|uniref:Integrase catalytic domain-containing protein n=1 Tax=Loxostege sticticalis TaxID=481309 RepID=A0ABR3I0C4_LOXSC
MSTDKDNTSSDSFDKQFVLLTAKKERLFSRMNDLFSLSTNISNYASRNNETFMAKSEQIDVMRSQFETIIDDLNDHQLSLDSSFKPDYKPLDAFDDLYLRVKHTRNRIMEVLRSDQSSSRNDSSNSNIGCSIKLPPIELPSFDGKTQNWPKFYESFKSNIHNNNQLTDSQRVQYLVGKLTHDALKFTAGIVPTGETYNIIWESLVKKFQDKRALGTHYLNNILDSKGCINTSNSLDTFIGMYTSSVASLKQLGIEDLSDFILFHCALRKIDSQTIQAFELAFRNKEIPSYNDLVSFVQDQAKILQRSSNNGSARASNSGASASKPSTNQSSRPQTCKSFVASNEGVPTTSPTKSCEFCNKTDHLIYSCSQFKNLSSPRTRFEFIKSKHGCVNCLSGSHTVTSCKSTHVCGVCKKKHHSYLHFDKKDHNIRSNNYVQVSQLPNSQGSVTSPVIPSRASCGQADVNIGSCVMKNSSADNSAPVSPEMRIDNPNPSVDVNHTIPSLSLSAEVRPTSSILLSTAQVYAKSQNGNKIMIRCLIDNGSQNNLITIDCCKALNLVIIPLSNSFVKGIGSASRPILGYVNLDIESRVYPNNKYFIHALVVDCITDQLPTHYITKGDIGYLEGLPLADLTWNIPGNVDVVLGAQLFPYIYLGNKVESGTSAPPTLLTAFGFVLMGDYPCNESQNKVSKTSFSALALNNLVQKFWQLEEIPNMQFLSPEETECENLFASSVTRADDGRALGNSRTAAQRRLMALERKFKQSPDLQEIYSNVLNEYIDNGYLSQVAESDITDEGYYIPHHAVTHPDKPMPRIVLDASAATHTGLSLNDVLHTGPNLQADLFLLLLDFRLFPVAMTADIKKMYLQIEVPYEHRKYLRILYRFNQNDLIRTFQFNRVPFGLKSSPFLAMRTVRQLAQDMRPHFPDAATVAESKLYMDDLVHSIADESSAIRLSRELISLFKSGAFDLVKWTSNCQVLLDNLPDSHRSTVDFSDDSSQNVLKVLGLSWVPVDDSFFFKTINVEEKCTKRSILSVVARLFDVLGLVAPIILYAKLLIKELWLSNIGWDDTPPESIIQKFSAFIQEFPLISPLKIPRHVGVLRDSTVLIVAFCDASMNGYGCVIYLHTTDPAGNITVRLLCAMSKVSPTKVTTLARLELCAAVLMSKLIRTVHETYRARHPIAGTYAFSDSTIALSWIHSSPHRWSVIVSNRVAQCQENLPPENYYHVAGCENPSDCLSRGMLPSQLMSHDLWWNGPSWIRNPPSEWPVKPFTPSNAGQLPELRAKVLTATVQCEPLILNELAQRISSWDELLRIVVYILRFIKKVSPSSGIVNNLMTAEKAVVRSVQRVHFAEDIKALNKDKLPSKKLQSLFVFLDEVGLLRIGGRLSNSDLPFEAKHPLLLPKHDPVVDLLIDHFHIMNCHTGPGLLISILRQRFWILDARTVVRARVRKCNYCFRVNPSHPTPMMADLPSYRVSEAKAFVHTGVDCAGPLRVTLTRRRGQHSQKAYICLFVCLVTKAIHIELVSELTSDAFLAAFKRFISRRLEYLHTLQVRQKWTSPDRRIEVGTVVLVGHDDCPPLSWPLGVITEIHPGSDKVVRVATVKTKCGIFKRPVVKLNPIPTQ